MSEVRIRINAGATLNLGNFESIRYDVAIEDSVRQDETVHDATLRIRGKVEAELQEALQSLEAEIQETKAANKRRGKQAG